MQHIDLKSFSEKIIKKRGDEGIRKTAKEIGISPSTLSRIEREYLPDLETFKLVCDWLEVNPGDVLGSTSPSRGSPIRPTTVHFKKDKTTTPKTAQHLADMILYAQKALELQNGE